MSNLNKEKLLKNKRAIEEINRHRWIESERQGHDIGFEQASLDWLKKFSHAWMNYHMPKSKTTAKSLALKKPTKPKATQKLSKQTRSKKS